LTAHRFWLEKLQKTKRSINGESLSQHNEEIPDTLGARVSKPQKAVGL